MSALKKQKNDIDNILILEKKEKKELTEEQKKKKREAQQKYYAKIKAQYNDPNATEEDKLRFKKMREAQKKTYEKYDDEKKKAISRNKHYSKLEKEGKEPKKMEKILKTDEEKFEKAIQLLNEIGKFNKTHIDNLRNVFLNGK
jgi:hypothetical protein